MLRVIKVDSWALVHNDDLCPIRICKVNFSRVGWWTPQFISVTG